MTEARGLATLIVNPAAWQASLLNLHLHEIELLLSSHGYTVSVVHTSSALDSAASLSKSAAADSVLVFACGGDGTVHGVIQGLAYNGCTFGCRSDWERRMPWHETSAFHCTHCGPSSACSRISPRSFL